MNKSTILFTLLCAASLAFAQRPTSYWSKTPFRAEAQVNVVAATIATTESEATVVLE